ncbi:MAG TPA: ergothioneine biosynthesis protein EgtB [Lacipirellulaceae bacterium]|nr:ergothioneine biosynthesis protein EgtB [Lacipirellulaceae bacterium]
MATTVDRDTAKTSLTFADRYERVRQLSSTLCETLEPEDCCIQSMADVSPTRWHLAHTTWFFETFVLSKVDGFRTLKDNFSYLFNSYYNAVGAQFPRARRGLLSRPTVGEVRAYRDAVDERMRRLLTGDRFFADEDLQTIVELGLNHEQQHQELMLTDIKHVFSCNPLWPVYRQGSTAGSGVSSIGNGEGWRRFDEGIYWIGHSGNNFAYDNESPRHRVFLDAFQLAERLVTCGEYLEFMADGGYRRPELWLSEGWSNVCEHHWQAPLYWHLVDEEWREFTLAGLVRLDQQRPLCHVNYFEADAYARWRGARIPTEAEWEVASAQVPVSGNFVDLLLEQKRVLHPSVAPAARPQLAQMFGDVWEWTTSSYAPYSGYQPAEGALGEYNGKFMCNQYVLRGGSCATPSDHIRRTYRNFFPASARWQFSGIRLAR